MSKLDHYVETAKAIAYKRGALWAASEDAFLTALAERLSHTGDKTVIGPGSLLRVDTRDRMGVLGCDLGILVPDPTENQGHEWAPFKPPAAGKRAGFSYALFVVQSGPPGSCGSLRPSEHAYPVRHGVYFLRLFSDAQAQIRGTQFLGYMASEIAIIKGASTAELLLMLRANNEEISHQAE